MKETKFYICERCGNLAEVVIASGVNMVCCGQKMTELKAGVVDASLEKHVPAVEIDGNTVNVTVGSVIHPMTPEHSIRFIALETDKGIYRRDFTPDDEPKATFILGDEKPTAVYEYCNLHGLWKKEI